MVELVLDVVVSGAKGMMKGGYASKKQQDSERAAVAFPGFRNLSQMQKRVYEK